MVYLLIWLAVSAICTGLVLWSIRSAPIMDDEPMHSHLDRGDDNGGDDHLFQGGRSVTGRPKFGGSDKPRERGDLRRQRKPFSSHKYPL
jgi:hypothetical protein